jgi:hypothetical protein
MVAMSSCNAWGAELLEKLGAQLNPMHALTNRTPPFIRGRRLCRCIAVVIRNCKPEYGADMFLSGKAPCTCMCQETQWHLGAQITIGAQDSAAAAFLLLTSLVSEAGVQLIPSGKGVDVFVCQ